MKPTPEIHISSWKVVIRGEAALAAAGNAIRFALICRAIGSLALPWLPYLLWRWWSG